MAISTQSKQFLSSPLVQNVINDIWAGRILLSSSTNNALVKDDYKTREITTYDFRNEPFLDHYRLRVPKYRAMLEFMNFGLLLFFFVLCLSSTYILFIKLRCTVLKYQLSQKPRTHGNLGNSLHQYACCYGSHPVLFSNIVSPVFASGFILDEFASSQVCPCLFIFTFVRS